MNTDKFVINVGRQLGSGGRSIGQELAKRFSIKYYDRKLLEIASKQSGLNEKFFEEADEKASKSLGGSGLFGSRFPFVADAALFCGSNYLSNDELFKIQSDVIRDLANEESSLFVGRCADYILRNHPRCINVFVSASMGARIKAFQSRNENVTENQARDILIKADKKRSTYYNYYSNKEWGVASTYHLCIESSVLGLAKTTDFIESFIREKLGV